MSGTVDSQRDADAITSYADLLDRISAHADDPTMQTRLFLRYRMWVSQFPVPLVPGRYRDQRGDVWVLHQDGVWEDAQGVRDSRDWFLQLIAPWERVD